MFLWGGTWNTSGSLSDLDARQHVSIMHDTKCKETRVTEGDAGETKCLRPRVCVRGDTSRPEGKFHERLVHIYLF